jgi:hypothetical protein
MVVRSIRFVLLLLLVVAAFGASAVRARAAEVRNETTPSQVNENNSASTSEVHQTKTELHSSETQVISDSQSKTIGGAVLSDNTLPPTILASSSEPIIQSHPTASVSYYIANNSVTVVQPASTVTTTRKHAVLAAESQTIPTQLQSTTKVQSAPQPSSPISHSNNPLMVLLAAASTTVSVLPNTLATWLSVVAATPAQSSLPDLASIVLVSLLIAGTILTFLKKTRFARAARSNPVASRTAMLQFAKSSSSWVTTQDSVFSCLVSNKIIKFNNIGGTQ